MSPLPSFALAVSGAIAKNSAPELDGVLRQAPAGWEAHSVGGFTCWSRVLVSPKRAPLMDVLIQAGWRPPATVLFRGQRRFVLELAIHYGNHAAVDRLLSASVSANLQVGTWSVLAYAVEQLSRAVRRQFPMPSLLGVERLGALGNPGLEKLAPLTQSLLDAGARPCPTTLGMWMILALARPDEPWLKWCEQAWAEGVRPQLPRQGPASVIPAIRAFVVLDSPILEGWLEHALDLTPPSPLWVEGLNVRFMPSFSTIKVPKLSRLFELMESRWDLPLDASTWDQKAVDTWMQWWSGQAASLEAHLSRPLLAMWAVDNHAPVSLFLGGKRPLLSSWMRSALFESHPAPTLALVERFLKSLPSGLDTPMPGASGGQTVGQVWKEMSEWKQAWPSVESSARELVCARLDESLPVASPKPASPRGRF